MTAKQILVAFLVIILIGLSIHEYWGPEVDYLL